MKKKALTKLGAKQTAMTRLDDLPELLTPEEAATVLRVSRNGMYELLKTGTIPSLKFGRLIRIKKTVLLEGGR
jgi:excisionase family DNA binding protein